MTALAGTYDESKHPRADDGKFGSGGGGGAKPTHVSPEAHAELKDLRAQAAEHWRKAAETGHGPHLAAFEEVHRKIEAHPARAAEIERQRQKLVKASVLRSKGIEVGDSAADVEAKEQAFQHTFQGKAELDDSSVRSLLGVADSDVHVRATVHSSKPGEVEIKSVLSDTKGNHLGMLNRTYTRDESGALTVHHDYFVLDDSQKGKGFGGKVIKNQLNQYEHLGVSKIETLAAWDGRYVWPKMGFELSDPGEKALLQKRWKSYTKRKGIPFVPVNGVQDVVAHPEGKAFLLGSRAPMLQLHATPAQLKAKLNAKRT